MFEFFDFIVGIVTSFVDFIVGTIEDTARTFKLIASGIVFLSESLDNLPFFCAGALEVIIALSVCTVVLGAFLKFK